MRGHLTSLWRLKAVAVLGSGQLLAVPQAQVQARHEYSMVCLAAEPVEAFCNHFAMPDESHAVERAAVLSVSEADSEFASVAAKVVAHEDLAPFWLGKKTLVS